MLLRSVKGFSIVNKAEVDIFLELFCFFYDPVDVGSLISGSSAFSIEPASLMSSALQVGFFLLASPGKPWRGCGEQIGALGSPDLQASCAEVMGDLGTHSLQLASEAGGRLAELSP